jgi:hypothetical protein
VQAEKTVLVEDLWEQRKGGQKTVEQARKYQNSMEEGL